MKKPVEFDHNFMQEANRLKRLPPYLFAIIDDLIKQAAASGKDVIDLSMGSPDLPAPPNVVQALIEGAKRDDTHGYSRSDGEIERKLRRAIADWYHKKFNVELNPDTEVLPLIGSKEGLAHLSLGFLNNDDIALVPSPTYPIHFNGVIMAGGILYQLPLLAENNFLPIVSKLDPHVVRQSKMMILSYPHNPTAATCDVAFMQEMVDWCKRHHIILAHDFAYSDFVYDGHKAPSILNAKGARDVAIEFHSFSKSYSMAGWRLAFAVGNASILKTLSKTKSYIDFGIFRAVQLAGIEALTGPQDYVKHAAETYHKRMKLFVEGLNGLGWTTPMPKATFYVWAHIPLKYGALTSMEFSQLMIEEGGVACSPGTGFGEYGEGYVRFAMIQGEERLKQALKRIGHVLTIG
jgi:aspartate/methionine/tyrosine aminotransferase